MIVFDNAGKAYRSRRGQISWVFRNFSATFGDKVSVGILGAAGSGRTTLIDVAAGNAETSEGEILRNGRTSWPFGFSGNLSNKLTGKQNLRFLTDIHGRDFTGALAFVSEFGELDRWMDISMRNYTPQMRVRFTVSAFLAMDFDRYLVDENMDLGEPAFRRKCTQYIESRADRLTFFMATDNPHLVSKYCQVGGVLQNGSLKIYDSIPAAISAFYHSRT